MTKRAFLYVYFILFTCLFIFFLREIDLTTTDFGRHIKNGEFVFKNKEVLFTNFYSYTYKTFPFINHHWGSGVVFYFVKSVFGFKGISIFFSLITTVTFLIFFWLAQKRSSFLVSLLVLILIIPLVFIRTEVRPEAFSYLLCGIFWLILNNKKNLYLLPFLMLLWINLHSYFFFGFLMMGVFWLNELLLVLRKKNKAAYLKKLSIFIIVSILFSLVNPSFVEGLLYPLNIFKNFGYRLLENQSTFFLEKVLGQYPAGVYFRIIVLLLAVSFIFNFIKNRRIEFIDLCLALFVTVIALKAVRNFAIFGFICLPVIAGNIKDLKLIKTDIGNKFTLLLLIMFIIPALFFISPQYWLQRNSIGLGLEEGEDSAAWFFINNKLKGPVFNNYDIGGYLIYYLFPKEEVFVDNRPEAYPADFFTKEYMPMQENNEEWNKAEKKYDFNTVFFYRLDLTPWAQKFLINLVKDPSWAPVYVDNKRIIFVKRINQNMEIIKKYEIPKEMFSFQ